MYCLSLITSPVTTTPSGLRMFEDVEVGGREGGGVRGTPPALSSTAGYKQYVA
jgi:hypothetical protein